MPKQATYPAQSRGGTVAADDFKLRVSGLNFYYGPKQSLFDVSLHVLTNRITALIGPSGCGKSTFLRTLNRMYETLPHARAEGEILFDDEDLLAMDPVALRRRVGMVFQRPNPFPKSIFDNIAYGLRVNGTHR
jgi:phosphate transport system ATP-binding protein